MTDAVVLASLLELLVGVGCLYMATLVWEYRHRPAGAPALVLALAAAGWAFAAAMASFVADPLLTRAAGFAGYWFAGVVAAAWFYAASEYADFPLRTHPVVSLTIAALVVSELAVLATAPVHDLYVTVGGQVTGAGLFDPTPGPLFVAYTAAKSAVVVAGIGTLVFYGVPNRPNMHTRTAVLVASGILPLVAALVEFANLVSVPGLDVGVVGLGLSAVLLYWVLTYGQALDVAPVARSSLVESIDVALLMLDSDDRVVDMNSLAGSVLDVDTGAIGRPAESVFPEYGHLVDSTGTGSLDFGRTVDGVTRRYELTRQPLRSHPRVVDLLGGGEPPTGTLVTFHDVTERVDRERLIRTQNRRLEQFASVVSHDLRNPLSMAIAWLDVARETNDSKSLATVAEAHTRMERLIDDLLTLAQSGEDVTDPYPVSLPTLAEGCWRNVDTTGATLVVDATVTVLAAGSRLEQLLENLLRNAVEHGDGGVTVTVGDLPGETGFYVADDGPGIPIEEREAVLEWGYSGTEWGTGFGLAIVSEVAESHGWTLRLTESVAGGARFEFDDVTVLE